MARDELYYLQEVPKKQLDPEQDPIIAARHHAVKLLVNREHSYYELYQKLCLKGHDSISAHCALDELVKNGTLSDHRFTEMFISSRVRRGTGPNKIIAELLKKDVSECIIHQTLSDTQVDWIVQAEQSRKKKFGNLIPNDYHEKMRQARFLENRGYRAEHMSNLLN